MAVAVAATTTDTAVGNLSFAHTMSGSNMLLLFLMGQRYGTGGPRNPTFNALPMTSLWDVDNGNLTRTAAWYWLGATGDAVSHNIVANVPTGDTARPVTATALSLTGVDQTTPFGTLPTPPVTGHDTTPTSTVASAVNDLVVDLVSWYVAAAETMAVGAGQTQRSNLTATAGGQTVGSLVSTEAGAASVTMSELASAAVYWNHVAIPVKAGGAAAGGSPLSAALATMMQGDGV